MRQDTNRRNRGAGPPMVPNDDQGTYALQRSAFAMTAWQSSFDGMVRFAEMTIRSLLILNGGAALAMIAFISQTASNPGSERGGAFWPLLLFGVGAILAVATAAMGYFSQAYFVETELTEQDRKKMVLEQLAQKAQIAAVFFGVSSMIAFILGMICASMFLT